MISSGGVKQIETILFNFISDYWTSIYSIALPFGLFIFFFFETLKVGRYISEESYKI